MRKEAVQNERDKITRRPTEERVDLGDGLSVSSLKKADLECQKFQFDLPVANQEVDSKPFANLSDIGDSMKKELLCLVEWAKQIHAFNGLLLDDQVALLRAHAGEHLVLGLARRSMNLNGVLLLSNNRILTRDQSELIGRFDHNGKF